MLKQAVSAALAAALCLQPAAAAAEEADLDGMVSNFAVGGINNGVILPEINNALAGRSGDGMEAVNTAVSRYVAFLDIASKLKDAKYSEASLSAFMTAYGEYVSAVAAAGAVPVWLPGPSYLAALVATVQFAGEMQKAARDAGMALEDDNLFSSISMDRSIAAYGQAIPTDDGTLLKIYLLHYLSGGKRAAIEKFLGRTAGFRLDFSEGDEKYKTYAALSAGGSFLGTLTKADLGPADKYVIGLLGGLVRKVNEHHKSVEAAHKAEVELAKYTKELGRLNQIFGSMPVAIQYMKSVEKIKPRVEGWKKLPAEAGALVAKAQALMKVEHPAESPRELCANARNKVYNAITGLQMTGLEPGLLKELQAKYPSILSQCGALGDALDAREKDRQEKEQREYEKQARSLEAKTKSQFDFTSFASEVSYSGPDVPPAKEMIDELDTMMESGEIPDRSISVRFSGFEKRIDLLRSDYQEAHQEFEKKLLKARSRVEEARIKASGKIETDRESCKNLKKGPKDDEGADKVLKCLAKADREKVQLGEALALFEIKIRQRYAAKPRFGGEVSARISNWSGVYQRAREAVNNPGGGMDSAEQALYLIGVRLDQVEKNLGSPFPKGYWTSEGVARQIAEEGCPDVSANYEHECVGGVFSLANRWAEEAGRAQASFEAAKAAQASYQSKLTEYLGGVEKDLSEIQSQLKSVKTSAEDAARAVAATPWFKKEVPAIAERIKDLMDQPDRLSQRLRSAKQEGSKVAATMSGFKAAVSKAAAHAEELANAHAAMKKIADEPAVLANEDPYRYLKFIAEGGDQKRVNQIGLTPARKQELFAELNKILSRIPDWAHARAPKFAKHLRDMVKALDKMAIIHKEVNLGGNMNQDQPQLPTPAANARLDVAQQGSKDPDASAKLQKVQALYRDFASAYQSRNAGAVTNMLSSDWQAPDGSGVSQAREALNSAFKTFSRVEFRLAGLNVTAKPDGTFEASYSAVIVGQLPGADIPHEEGFSATEIVAWEDGKPVIKKTVRASPRR